MLNDVDVKTVLGETISYDPKAFNLINFIVFASGLSSSDTLQLYDPQSGKHGARRRSFHNESNVTSKSLGSKGIDTFLNLENGVTPGLLSDSNNNNYIAPSSLCERIKIIIFKKKSSISMTSSHSTFYSSVYWILE